MHVMGNLSKEEAGIILHVVKFMNPLHFIVLNLGEFAINLLFLSSSLFSLKPMAGRHLQGPSGLNFLE